MDDKASLSKQEIIDLASRYTTSEEVTDFQHDGELFCLLERKVPDGKVLSDDEGWTFGGYGMCLGYMIDESEMPAGKWLLMRFASLSAFPPVAQTLKLQPPHVVRGRFQSPDRSSEFRLIKIALNQPREIKETGASAGSFTKRNPSRSGGEAGGKILAFRPKNEAKET